MFFFRADDSDSISRDVDASWWGKEPLQSYFSERERSIGFFFVEGFFHKCRLGRRVGKKKHAKQGQKKIWNPVLFAPSTSGKILARNRPETEVDIPPSNWRQDLISLSRQTQPCCFGRSLPAALFRSRRRGLTHTHTHKQAESRLTVLTPAADVTKR